MERKKEGGKEISPDDLINPQGLWQLCGRENDVKHEGTDIQRLPGIG